MYTICMPLYLYIYIYILYMYIRGGGGARAGTNPLWSNHTATLPPSPPKKRGKNKIDAENGVFGIRVHHNCRKQFGMVEFFRTRLVPTLFWRTPLCHFFFAAVVVHADSKNMMFCVYLVFPLFLVGGW